MAREYDRLVEMARVSDQARKLLTLVDSILVRGSPLFIEFRKSVPVPTWAFIHPSTAARGKFRFTRFDELGWIGHNDFYETPADALADMVVWGYVEEDRGALASFMKRELWRLGTQLSELVALSKRLAMAGKTDIPEYYEVQLFIDELRKQIDLLREQGRSMGAWL